MKKLPCKRSAPLLKSTLCISVHLIDAFHGAWLHLPEGKSQGLFSATVCKIQASKCYIKYLLLVPKEKEAASLKVKGLLYSCLLITCLPSGSRTLNWHLETIYNPNLTQIQQTYSLSEIKIFLPIRTQWIRNIRTPQCVYSQLSEEVDKGVCTWVLIFNPRTSCCALMSPEKDRHRSHGSRCLPQHKLNKPDPLPHIDDCSGEADVHN